MLGRFTLGLEDVAGRGRYLSDCFLLFQFLPNREEEDVSNSSGADDGGGGKDQSIDRECV